MGPTIGLGQGVLRICLETTLNNGYTFQNLFWYDDRKPQFQLGISLLRAFKYYYWFPQAPKRHMYMKSLHVNAQYNN